MAEYTAQDLKLDYFSFYQSAAQSFQAIVGLQCQFDKSPEKAQLTYNQYFANPTSKNGQPIYDKHAHFTWYNLMDQVPDGPRAVRYVNQFGENQLITGRAVALLAPTQKREAGSVFPEHLDHYKVFQVLRGEPVGANLALEDQFGKTETEVFYPRFFAVPTTKMWEGQTFKINNEDAHLLIYIVHPAQIQKTIVTRDQFSPRYQHLSGRVLLGAPTKKTQWKPLD